MSEFDAATAVRRITDGCYEGAIVPGWDIAGNANGGYLLAMVARAMADAVERPPLSITAHYLAPGRVGSVEIGVDVVRAGRRLAVVRSTMSAAGDDVLVALGTFGDQPDPADAGPSVIDAAPPDLPPIEECVPGGPPASAGPSGFGDRVLSRYHPGDVGFREGRPSGTAEVRGWFELADRAAIDVFGLLLAADTFAPVCFNRPEFPVSWAPTLELTAHIRERPVPGPLRVRFRSRFIQNGMFEEDGEVWDGRGVLVAQSRQLALIPRP